MMERVPDNNSDNDISLLICEFMGVNVGIDMAQVAEICEVTTAEEKGMAVFYLHEKISRLSAETEYKTPRALIVEQNGKPAGIVVDMPREIVSIPITSIRPLPRLIELFKESTPVWGVTLWQNSIVLLVDLLSLFDS